MVRDWRHGVTRGFVARWQRGGQPHPAGGPGHLHPWGAAAWAPPARPGSGCVLHSKCCDLVTWKFNSSLLELPKLGSTRPWFWGTCGPRASVGAERGGINPTELLFPLSAEKLTCFGSKEPPSNHLRFSQRSEWRLFRNRQRLCLHTPARAPDALLPGTAGHPSAPCLR